MIEYFLCLIIFFTIYLLVNHKKDPRLPPGRYGWPIFGSPPSTKIPFVEQLEECQKMYGDIFLWRVGARNVVYLCNPKIIRSALTNPHILDRPDEWFTFDTWSYNKKMGLVNNNGISWQTTRRFALRHLRNSGLGTSSAENIIVFEAESLIKDLESNLDTPTELKDTINVATLNVIWKLTADIRFERDDEEIMKINDSIRDVFTLLEGAINIFDMFPWIQYITPNFVMDRIGFTKLQEIRSVIRTYFKSVVDKRKAALNPEAPYGYIDGYLLEIEAKKDDPESPFSEKDLILSLGDLFIAGSDTTATTLRWSLLYMACYPETQKKIQAEIDSIVPRDRFPSLTDKDRLPFTEATTYEILRKTSLAILGLFRSANEDTQIDEYFIPKNTIVLPFFYGCHRDPDYWEKPLEFYPEHFLDNDGKFTAKNEAFMPFGAGKRNCLGESLARTEIFLLLCALLQRFSFCPAEGETLSVEQDPSSVLFNKPRKFKLIVKKRD